MKVKFYVANLEDVAFDIKHHPDVFDDGVDYGMKWGHKLIQYADKSLHLSTGMCDDTRFALYIPTSLYYRDEEHGKHELQMFVKKEAFTKQGFGVKVEGLEQIVLELEDRGN